MMMLPRDLSASDLVRALSLLGYQIVRRKGSHIRLTTERGGQHHLTLPDHDPLRMGTGRRQICRWFVGRLFGAQK